jgi:hypothetical protein
MTIYTIVDKHTDPLGPNEVHAGDTIQVSDGDTYIIASSANGNITFQAYGGGPASFDIIFDGSNSNGFDIKIEEDLTPSVSIPDNADLTDIKLDAKGADAVTFTAGDNVSFGEYDGSAGGADIISIGDGFTTNKNWKTGGGDDALAIGDDATFKNIDSGAGDDTITFGKDATVSRIDTKEGADSVRVGDDADLDKIKTGDGNDSIYLGEDAQIKEVDGGDGNDTFTTATTGVNSKKLETTNVVCFAKGTMIEADIGPVAVETLTIGAMVHTVDHGPQPVRWIGSMRIDGPTLAAQVRLRPISIAAGALGEGIPSTDLVVSPQHRILMRSKIAMRMFERLEVFVPAKLLTVLPGITCECPEEGVEYHHVLFDRHEVLIANGAESESLFLGPQAVNSLGSKPVIEIETADLMPGGSHGAAATARLSPSNGKRLRQLLERHLANGKPAVSTPCVRQRALNRA